jgi:alkanesulfonate monooxygenase
VDIAKEDRAMPLHLHWFLPLHGDGREITRVSAPGVNHGARTVQRPPDLDYLTQVALAAERFGFTGMLTPTGLFCEDPWLATAMLATRTTRIKFMVAFRPGLVSPTLTAQMAATFQRMSGNRLLLNVVTGGDPDELRRYGDDLDHDQRYVRADEFLTVLRGAWQGGPFDFAGEHYHVTGAMLPRPPEVVPPVFLGGSSAAARRVASHNADVYLTWGEPPAQTAELIEAARRAAAEHDRRLSFGARFHVITRDTSKEAWAEAERLVEGLDPARVRSAQERFRRTESEGQRRMARLHEDSGERLEIYPNMWIGYSLLRPGPGTALVGSHEEVADRIVEFHDLGIEHLILSGQPHLEEAYWFGEGVMPLLRERGVVASVNGSPS